MTFSHWKAIYGLLLLALGGGLIYTVRRPPTRSLYAEAASTLADGQRQTAESCAEVIFDIDHVTDAYRGASNERYRQLAHSVEMARNRFTETLERWQTNLEDAPPPADSLVLLAAAYADSLRSWTENHLVIDSAVDDEMRAIAGRRALPAVAWLRRASTAEWRLVLAAAGQHAHFNAALAINYCARSISGGTSDYFFHPTLVLASRNPAPPAGASYEADVFMTTYYRPEHYALEMRVNGETTAMQGESARYVVRYDEPGPKPLRVDVTATDRRSLQKATVSKTFELYMPEPCPGKTDH